MPAAVKQDAAPMVISRISVIWAHQPRFRVYPRHVSDGKRPPRSGERLFAVARNMLMRRTKAPGWFAVVAVAGVVALLVVACSSERSGPLVEDDPTADSFDYDYLIPAGTADRISNGESVEILPAELLVKVGDVIRIVNEDDEGHFVGIFYVGAGETVTQRFTSSGEFIGACTVHPSGQLRLVVSG